MDNKFKNQVSGSEFWDRNKSLDFFENKAGRLWFSGSKDERGYVSKEAAELLRLEMNGGSSLEAAVGLLSFSVIETLNDDGKLVEIPTLHLTPVPPIPIWSK